MRRMLTLVAGALLVATGAASHADLILENPGFETGEIEPWDHWQFTPGDPPPPDELWVTTTDNPHGGEYCAVGWGSNYVFRQTFEPVHGDDITEFSCWIRQDDPGLCCLDVYFDDPDDGLPGVGQLSFASLTSTDWELHDGLEALQSCARFAEAILGPGARLVSVGIMGTYETHTYVDDWVLVPEPASVALLCVGLLPMLRRGRA